MAVLSPTPVARVRRAVRGAALAVLFALLPLAHLSAQAVHPTADQVKAVFLFNFAQFVEWPDAAFAGPGAPLVIGIVGDDPFGSFLDETVRGETVRGRPLIVRRGRQVEAVGKCHIIFLRPPENEEIQPILDALRGQPTLTVSDAPGFLRRGGMVGFAFERNRVRVRINPDAATGAGLKMSSKLLQAAELVTPGNP